MERATRLPRGTTAPRHAQRATNAPPGRFLASLASCSTLCPLRFQKIKARLASCLYFLERATRLELASRHPTNRLAAIRRSPASPRIQCAFGAGGGSAFSSSNKKQDIQIGCPVSLWSGRRGSNSLPPPWQGGALPDELRPRNSKYYNRHFPVCQGQIRIFLQELVANRGAL